LPAPEVKVFVTVSVAVTALVGGCGAEDSAVCLTNELAEVCATPVEGAIEFSGSGLTPGTEVLIDHPVVGASVYRVGDDGTFDPAGRGVLSFVAGAPLTFTVAAIDSGGRSLEGQLVVTS
jgi:hypothetical protein